MNEKIKNGFEWIKEHKKGIAIAGVATMATVIGGIVLHKKIDHDKITACMKNVSIKPKITETIDISDIGVGKIEDVLRYEVNGVLEMWIDKIPLADMGKLGEAISEHFPDVKNDSEVFALLSISNNET